MAGTNPNFPDRPADATSTASSSDAKNVSHPVPDKAGMTQEYRTATGETASTPHFTPDPDGERDPNKFGSHRMSQTFLQWVLRNPVRSADPRYLWKDTLPPGEKTIGPERKGTDGTKIRPSESPVPLTRARRFTFVAVVLGILTTSSWILFSRGDRSAQEAARGHVIEAQQDSNGSPPTEGMPAPSSRKAPTAQAAPTEQSTQEERSRSQEQQTPRASAPSHPTNEPTATKPTPPTAKSPVVPKGSPPASSSASSPEGAESAPPNSEKKPSRFELK